MIPFFINIRSPLSESVTLDGMAAKSDIWSDDDPVHGQSATRCCDARYVESELIYLFDQRLPLVRGWAFKQLPLVGSRWILTILNSYLTMSQCNLHCHWSDMSFLDKLLLSAFTCSWNTFTEFSAAWMPSLPCQIPLQLACIKALPHQRVCLFSLSFLTCSSTACVHPQK